MRKMSFAGYTILEVLLFLAISSALFASAVVAVNGNQARVQYSQAVRDLETQIKDVMNDVVNGYYPYYDRGNCSVDLSGNYVWTTGAAGSSEPGSNIDCINIGKNLMFNLRQESLAAGTIVGRNPQIGASTNLSLASLSPTLAFNEGANQIDLTEFKPIRFGARITKIGSDSYPAQQFSSLMIVSGFSTSAGLSTRTDGTLNLNLYGYEGTIASNSTMNDYEIDVEAMDTASATELRSNPPEGFYVCLLTTDNKRARVIVGAEGSVTATRTEFDLVAGAVCP